jgi:hypothetical protein
VPGGIVREVAQHARELVPVPRHPHWVPAGDDR